MINSCAAIVIAAKHGELIKVKDASGIAHTIGTLRCKFEFRTSDWDYTTRTAVFCKGNMATHPGIVDTAIGVLLDNVDECAVPPEVLLPDARYFSVGVWGVTNEGLRIVSKWLVFRIEDGCYVDSVESVMPTPSVYEQIVAELGSKAPIEHEHDDKYYPREEIDDKLKHIELEDVPTKVSQLENDAGYITSIPNEYITEEELNSKGYLTEHQSLEAYAKKTEIPDLSELEDKTSNLEKSKLDKSSLDQAIDEALEQAKASGEFDGKDGTNGINGTNGTDGKDGKDGVNGADGKDGADGLTPYIAENGNWWIGDEDTGVKAEGVDGTSISHQWNGTVLSVTSASGTTSSDLKGERGSPGTGISGIQVNVDNTTGKPSAEVDTMGDFNNVFYTINFSGLKGETGAQGEKGEQGDTGLQGEKGDAGYSPIKGTDYWTETDKNEIKQYVDRIISETGHASFEKVNNIPSVEEAKENVLYLVPNGKNLDIYAKIGEEVVLIDDTDTDLSGYLTKTEAEQTYPTEARVNYLVGTVRNDAENLANPEIVLLENGTDGIVQFYPGFAYMIDLSTVTVKDNTYSLCFMGANTSRISQMMIYLNTGSLSSNPPIKWLVNKGERDENGEATYSTPLFVNGEPPTIGLGLYRVIVEWNPFEENYVVGVIQDGSAV